MKKNICLQWVYFFYLLHFYKIIILKFSLFKKINLIYIYSLFLISFNFLFLWLNIRVIGYIGIYIITSIILLFVIWYFLSLLYIIWFDGLIIINSIFLWVDFLNELNIYFNFLYDIFSCVLSLVVCTAAYLVINFVVIDLWDDKEGSRFIIILGFFIIFMLFVINSGNIIIFYLGWEGIGITSLLLVNFWSDRVRSIKASFKIFFISKFGDIFVLILICFLSNFFLTFDFIQINSNILLFLDYNLNLGFLNLNLLDFMGVITVLGGAVKSAQFGFHFWLLDAMEAPLGASALMHSSTLVVSGLVLIQKMSSLIEVSSIAQILMFSLGIFSAFWASFIACTQIELKGILAYSTISNMGYIFILFSLGAYFEMYIIIILHAYIKIFLFLIIGGIILHCNGLQDIRKMGGLLLYIPVLWVAYIIGGLSLAGIPFLTGYYSKHYILLALTKSELIILGLEIFLYLSFFFTFFYIWLIAELVFLNSKNGHKNIYSIKPIPILYIMDIIIFIFFVIILGLIWDYFYCIEWYSLHRSIIFKSYIILKYYYYKLTIEILYWWLLIYIISFFTIMFWYLCTKNMNFKTHQFWYWFHILFLLFFLNYYFLWY